MTVNLADSRALPAPQATETTPLQRGTTVATCPGVKLCIATLALLVAATGVARADSSEYYGDEPPLEPALVRLEARLARGIAMGGGAGEAYYRSSPYTFSATADVAIRDEPWTSLYGGVVVEAGDRLGAGATAGLRVKLGGALRAAGGVVGLLVPSRVFGPSGSIGACTGRGASLCLDLEAVMFVGGKDLPDERIAGQLLVAVGVAFDAM